MAPTAPVVGKATPAIRLKKFTLPRDFTISNDPCMRVFGSLGDLDRGDLGSSLKSVDQSHLCPGGFTRPMMSGAAWMKSIKWEEVQERGIRPTWRWSVSGLIRGLLAAVVFTACLGGWLWSYGYLPEKDVSAELAPECKTIFQG